MEPLDDVLARASALHRDGAVAQAEPLYREVLRHVPCHARGLYLLGLLLLQTGRAGEGVRRLEAAVAIDGNVPELHVNLGVGLVMLGRCIEALSSYDRALALQPIFVGAWVNRGNVLMQMGRPAEALESYERAVKLDPNALGARNGVGNALLELNRPAEAIAHFDAALRDSPGSGFLWLNRATAHLRIGRPEDALRDCESARVLGIDSDVLHFTAGNALLDIGEAGAAAAAFARAHAVNPGHARARYNGALALFALGQLDLALAGVEAALQVRAPSDTALQIRADALLTRWRILVRLEREADACATRDALLDAAPDHAFIRGEALYEARRRGDWALDAEWVEDLLAGVRRGARLENPYTVLTATDSPELQRQCAQAFARATVAAPPAPWRPRPRRRHGPIRIAYVSADFRDHVCAELVVPLLERHDRRRFEIHGISIGPDDGTSMRRRVERACDAFLDARRWSPHRLVTHLRDLDIDIAVDLGGYTLEARPAIFALRPAPVQVNFLGYPGTLGVDWCDYLIADRVVVPESQFEHYAESVVWLPDCYLPNHAERPLPAAVPPRPELDLADGAFVYCCFNASWKVTPEVFDRWMNVLRAVPSAVLWLRQDHAPTMQRLRARARARGVHPERLMFAGRADPLAHLQRLAAADLFLDTYPYTAHSTAADALWMGVPVLTRPGQSFASRVAASLNVAMSMPEFNATDAAAYENFAIWFASDSATRLECRVRLDTARTGGRVFDAENYCRALETAYETMWARHAAGTAPAHFAVPSSSRPHAAR